ncbi:MAG TPA: hypothetical protein VN840_17825 [Streptosporangiaceae bacterium]|nr:hypothetical protein [Streptosporangiaceae bacterium]
MYADLRDPPVVRDPVRADTARADADPAGPARADTTRADADPADAAVRCPGCDSRYATWVSTSVQENLLCLTCGACWHGTGATWERVSMRDCAGCDYQAVCLAAR